jgi:hypothetical protein
MTRNIGTTDKIIRIILGIVIIVLGFVFSTWWGLIGILPLGTALINWCPLYRIFGWSTHKAKEATP